LAHHTIQPVPIKPWHEWALAALVAALAVGASWVGIHNGLTYDDVPIIALNPTVHTLDGWWRLFNASYWPRAWGADGYRPLTVLAFALEWAVAGGKTWPFHAANIALYAVSATLMFFLARTVLPVAAAFLAAALFAVHPLHVEAVAGVVGQAELLVAVLVIPAVTLYINGRNGEGLTRRRQVAICVLFALSVLAKEHGVVLPLLLLAAELIVVNDKASLAKRFVPLRPFVLALTAIALGFLWLHGHVSSELSTGFHPFIVFTTNRIGSEGRIWTMFGLVPDWIRLFLWPARLQTEYGPPEYPVVREFAAYQLPGMLILLAVVTLMVIAARRKSTAVAFGLASALIALLPTSNFIVPTGILLAERTLFLPSAGVMIAVGASVPWLYRHLRPQALRMAAAGAFVVLIALGTWRSHNRTKVWKSNDTLFAQSIVDAPYVYRSHYILGAWEFQKQHKKIGEQHYLRAIQLFDRDPYVFFGLGDQYLGFHMYRPSVTYFNKVLQIDSTFVEARARLALALTMLGRYDEAEIQARRALHEETRSGSTMRWCLAVIKKYKPTGRPPVVLPSDTASSASGKLPPPLQKAAPDTAITEAANSKSK
jgi:protein O-mannosyl-transferase